MFYWFCEWRCFATVCSVMTQFVILFKAQYYIIIFKKAPTILPLLSATLGHVSPDRGNIVGWVFHPTRWLARFSLIWICLSFQILNLFRTLSSWGSINYRPSAPLLHEVASHVKQLPFRPLLLLLLLFVLFVLFLLLIKRTAFLDFSTIMNCWRFEWFNCFIEPYILNHHLFRLNTYLLRYNYCKILAAILYAILENDPFP